jgi:hypothetical protein
MIEEQLIQYGMAGLFIAYLIYSQQNTIAGLKKVIETNTRAINELLYYYRGER